MGISQSGSTAVASLFNSMRSYWAATLLLTWAACMITVHSEVAVQEEVASTVEPDVDTQGVDTAVLWPTFTVDAKRVKPGLQGELELLEVGENGDPEEKVEEKEEEEVKKKEAKNSEYFKIPHLKYEFESHSIPKIPLGKCKATCDEKKGEGGKPECKSFSFNEQTNECLWSEEAFHFNPGWVYYSKESKGQYRAIPGLKYQTVQGKKDSEQTTAMQCQDE